MNKYRSQVETNIVTLAILREHPDGLPISQIYQKGNMNHSTFKPCLELLERKDFVTIEQHGKYLTHRVTIKITPKGIDLLRNMNPDTYRMLIELGMRLTPFIQTGIQNP